MAGIRAWPWIPTTSCSTDADPVLVELPAIPLPVAWVRRERGSGFVLNPRPKSPDAPEPSSFKGVQSDEPLAGPACIEVCKPPAPWQRQAYYRYPSARLQDSLPEASPRCQQLEGKVLESKLLLDGRGETVERASRDL